jgi:general secretion pathway protein G
MKRNKGFTFVELLVVITIIAVLTAVGMVSYQSTAKGSRDAKRKTDLENIRSALEICRLEDGEYPASIDTTVTCTGGTVTMSDVPVDPKTEAEYDYTRTSDTTYTLDTTLEKDGEYVVTNP